ncbi:MAG: hypothetical protein CMF59_10340, partial [Leptospiraceae bacterium]|nr:hypothetical protein [Leptospiraceae bacterium]
MKAQTRIFVSIAILVFGVLLHLAANCGYPPTNCRSDDFNCVERALPAIIWLSTCNYVPPCQNQTVDAPGFNVGRQTSLFANCQRINIAHANPSNAALRFARSNDAGMTWYISDVEVGADLGYDSEIFARGDEIFIVHNDADDLNNRFAYSSDAGRTWSTSQLNDPAFDTSGEAAITVIGNEVYIVLSYLGVQLLYSQDQGQSWSVIEAEGDNSKGADPSIVVDGDRIFIAHQEQGIAQDLFVTRSLNRGSTWETIAVQTTDDVGAFSSIVM